MKYYKIYEHTLLPSTWEYKVEAESEESALEQVKRGEVEPLNFDTVSDGVYDLNYTYEIEEMENEQ